MTTNSDLSGASEVSLKDLLQAGVHFGHQTSRWNPKMRRYIFAERGGIYLIDLKKTLKELQKAQELVRQTIIAGKTVLFVCTKPQVAASVRQEAERCGAFYVTERWLGGMLTNFQTIKKNIRRLKELERGAEEGAFEFYTKKERLLLERERQKLDRYLSGIKDMTRVPGLVFVADARKEEIAVREANRLKIPVVAIADTNANPDLLTIPIAGNDDAIRSVSLITKALADAVEMARRQRPEITEEEEEAYVYSTDRGESEDLSRPRGKRRWPRPRRRPRPEAIAKRLGTAGGTGEGQQRPSLEEPGQEEPSPPEPESTEGIELGATDSSPEVEPVELVETAESPVEDAEEVLASAESEAQGGSEDELEAGPS